MNLSVADSFSTLTPHTHSGTVAKVQILLGSLFSNTYTLQHETYRCLHKGATQQKSPHIRSTCWVVLRFIKTLPFHPKMAILHRGGTSFKWMYLVCLLSTSLSSLLRHFRIEILHLLSLASEVCVLRATSVCLLVCLSVCSVVMLTKHPSKT